ncbi:unnamed protein product [Cladocopium goreaui]|uniref:Uncharacterized protein n=1 Tax=Cladocopium goreaui TaxID=2562237 RepID=A0A9P1FQ42_9DINO|nr:unnamed protein product [Cladocopium goreaui]
MREVLVQLINSWVVVRNKISTLRQHKLAISSSCISSARSLNELWLKGNPIERLHLQAMPGFEDFLERRKQRLDARIGSNVVGRVDLSVCGLD